MSNVSLGLFFRLVEADSVASNDLDVPVLDSRSIHILYESREVIARNPQYAVGRPAAESDAGNRGVFEELELHGRYTKPVALALSLWVRLSKIS
jgi:hypothetical protein